MIIAMLAVLIVYNVMSRNLGFGSLGWIMEGSEYALGVATFLGAPWVLYENAHVRIDILYNNLPSQAGRRLEILINLCGAAIAIVFLYFMMNVGVEYYTRGTRVFKAFVFPEWWTFVIPVLSFGLLIVEFLRRFWRLVVGDT
ncbi:TRAP transporter small permease [Saccharospirillum sp.]|uniref:TRAP transporter small permease n=1 Tax=Saccharospirillum sp. TaxID=2033801 RepID=UPI0034A07469